MMTNVFAHHDLRKYSVGDPVFEDDKKFLPLQAADMIAWHLHRRKCHPKERKPLLYDRLTAGKYWNWFYKPEQLKQLGFEFGLSRGLKLVDLLPRFVDESTSEGGDVG